MIHCSFPGCHQAVHTCCLRSKPAYMCYIQPRDLRKCCGSASSNTCARHNSVARTRSTGPPVTDTTASASAILLQHRTAWSNSKIHHGLQPAQPRWTIQNQG
jgi:hypothetical protein